MKWVGLIAVLFTGGLLLSAMDDFPKWGDAHSPANASPVSQYFIEQTMENSGVPNMVTAVLADYRGYDTMFETVVVLIAGIAIMAILRVGNQNPDLDGHHRRDGDDRGAAVYGDAERRTAP